MVALMAWERGLIGFSRPVARATLRNSALILEKIVSMEMKSGQSGGRKRSWAPARWMASRTAAGLRAGRLSIRRCRRAQGRR